MRILHVCGATRGAPWLCEIVREQVARGHDVTVVVPSGDGPLPDSFRRDKVRFLVQPHDPFATGELFVAWRAIHGLTALLVAERPHIIQSHLFPANVAARIASWLVDVPIRLSMNAGPYVLESPVLREIEVLTANLDTKVVASCMYSQQLYVELGMPRERTALVYYGSNPRTFNPDEASPAAARRSLNVHAETPLVGLVAYFYPPAPDSPTTPPKLIGRALKGHDVLLRAIPAILERVPDARFVFVGEGSGERGVAYQREVEEVTRSLGLERRVIFAGYRSDVPDLLASFDVAVQCALSENVGGAIEALMMGVPTVVSDTGGLTDAVRHNETGLVVPPDDPDALANAVVTLLSNRAYARQLATRGRALMLDRFTVARTVDDLDALYAECRAQALRGGSPSTVDGYRLTRRIARLLLLPTLALRLLPPVLRAATGDRVRSVPGLMFLAMKQVPVRAFEIVAAVFVLGLTSPYFLWKRVRRPAMPMFAKLTVSGRHGMPLVLTRFAVEPKAPWLRRLPWFLTLLTTRQLALFGPTPEPHDPAHRRARTDPAVRRRPGVICFRAKLASAEPARQPPPSQARRPS
jgi:glycosyltransferase involved in cell wall biosynthesis